MITCFVTYLANCGHRMQAAVTGQLADGSLKVEPYFYLDAAGQPRGPFQGGFTLELAPGEFQTA